MSRPPISVPLPLPIHFTLLPTILPGESLAPLLYSLINDVPIYLTLFPSHQPHFSLLPLFLCISPPIPPLHILVGLSLKPEDYSLDIDGTAPFVDIWVPWHVARNVCEKMNLGHLFWDNGNPAKGLLAERTREIVSWDEIDSFGHNWIPPPMYVPASSYSLTTLLSVPFNSISLIPKDNCIYTKIDRGRRAIIRNLAEDEDHSQIRLGQWETIWECLARWNVLAWEAYRRYPSRPSTKGYGERPHSNDLAAIVHTLLPALARMSALPPTLTPSLYDLESLFPTPSERETSIQSTLFQLLELTWSLIWQIVCSLPIPLLPILSCYVPFFPFQKAAPEAEMIKQIQLHARLNIAFVESVTQLLIGAWRLDRERSRLADLLGGGNPGVNVIVPSTPIKAEDDLRKKEPGPSEDSIRRRAKKARRRGEIEDLERRRGGSPATDSDKTPQPHHSGRMKSPLEQSVSLSFPGPSQMSTGLAGPSGTSDIKAFLGPAESGRSDRLPEPALPIITGWSPPEDEDTDTDARPVDPIMPQSAGLSDSDSDGLTPLQRHTSHWGVRRSSGPAPRILVSPPVVPEITPHFPPRLVYHPDEEEDDADKEDEEEDMTPLQRSPRARRAGHGHRRSLSISLSPHELVTPETIRSQLQDAGEDELATPEELEEVDDEGEASNGQAGADTRVMQSEGNEGWYVYLSILASIVMAIALGVYQR